MRHARHLSAVLLAISLPLAGVACSGGPERQPAPDGASAGAPAPNNRSARERIEAISRRPSPEHLSTLHAALDSPEPDVRRLAVQSLAILAAQESIPALYELSLNDPDPRVAAAAADALLVYPGAHIDDAVAATDPVLIAREQRRQANEYRRHARANRRLERIDPPASEEQIREWARDINDTVGISIERSRMRLVADHAPPSHPLGYDGEANAGELLEYRLTLTNSSLGPRTSSSAFCYTFDPYVTIINRELMLPVMDPGETAMLNQTLMVLTHPDAPEVHTATLFLEVGDTELDKAGDGPVWRAFGIRFTNRGFGPVEFRIGGLDDDSWGQSDGNGDGRAEWGERVELAVDVRNLGSDTMRGARLYVRSLSPLANVAAPITPSRGDVPPGGRSGFSAIWSVLLAEGYSGAFSLPLILELRVPLVRDAGNSDTRMFATEREEEVIPTAFFTFRQQVMLKVGTGTVEPVDEPYTYQPFDSDTLIKVFVASDSHQLREDWLEEAEAAFYEHRDLAITEYTDSALMGE